MYVFEREIKVLCYGFYVSLEFFDNYFSYFTFPSYFNINTRIKIKVKHSKDQSGFDFTSKCLFIGQDKEEENPSVSFVAIFFWDFLWSTKRAKKVTSAMSEECSYFFLHKNELKTAPNKIFFLLIHSRLDAKNKCSKDTWDTFTYITNISYLIS